MSNYSTTNFQPKPTKHENLSEAERWLNKAVQLEGEGKSAAMVTMAFNKAHDYERAALGY